MTPPRPIGSCEYAPDGVISADWRLVRKHKHTARVKFFGQWWESDKIVPYIGSWVWVSADTYWIVSVSIFRECWSELIVGDLK